MVGIAAFRISVVTTIGDLAVEAAVRTAATDREVTRELPAHPSTEGGVGMAQAEKVDVTASNTRGKIHEPNVEAVCDLRSGMTTTRRSPVEAMYSRTKCPQSRTACRCTARSVRRYRFDPIK